MCVSRLVGGRHERRRGGRPGGRRRGDRRGPVRVDGEDRVRGGPVHDGQDVVAAGREQLQENTLRSHAFASLGTIQARWTLVDWVHHTF